MSSVKTGQNITALQGQNSTVGTPSSFSFVHPGIPHTIDQLNTLKANLTAEPWKTGYASLTATYEATPTYLFKSIPTAWSRNPDSFLNQFNSEMLAIYLYALRWYFSGDNTWAQKARNALINWSTLNTVMSGAEPYLAIGFNAWNIFGGAEILRYTWPGWTDADSKIVENYFLTVFWGKGGNGIIDSTSSLRGGNQGLACLAAALGIAIFCNDRNKFDQCVQQFRMDLNAGIGETTSVGFDGEAGRDQGHHYDHILLMAWIAEVLYTQGVDVYSELDNRILAVCEMFSRYNYGKETVWPLSGYGCQIGYYSQWGGAPNSSPQPPDMLNMVYSHYVTRKGLSAPWTSLYRDTRTETLASFVYRLSSNDNRDVKPRRLVPYPSTSSVTRSLSVANIGSPTPGGVATYNNSTQTWTMSAAGTNIFTTQNFSFFYLPVTGDCTVIAKLNSLYLNNVNYTRAGVMIRNSLDANAAHLCTYQRGLSVVESYTQGYTNIAHFQYYAQFSPTPVIPIWFRAIKQGRRIRTAISPDGANWTTAFNGTFDNFSSTVYAGICVCSYSGGNNTQAVFSDVRITGGDGLEPLKAPSAPLAAYAAPGTGQAIIRWTESVYATSYNIKRGTVSGGPYTTIASVSSGASYTDSVSNGQYYYVVSAVNSVGESGNSIEDVVTI
jgi:regulation of enolase protein 1 (concanavalin A-like superfamily)